MLVELADAGDRSPPGAKKRRERLLLLIIAIIVTIQISTYCASLRSYIHPLYDCSSLIIERLEKEHLSRWQGLGLPRPSSLRWLFL